MKRYYLSTRTRIDVGPSFDTRVEAEAAIDAAPGWRVVPDDDGLDGPYIDPAEVSVFDVERRDDRSAAEIERDVARADVERLCAERDEAHRYADEMATRASAVETIATVARAYVAAHRDSLTDDHGLALLLAVEGA